jgi:hypothetical protein
MAVHILHVSKTGGTAVRAAVRESRQAAGGALFSPWGPVWAYSHGFRLRHVPKDDVAILTLRDPLSRFLSGFCSRQRKGAPRHLREWSDAERLSFEWFSTPQELADALAEPPGTARHRAEFAMNSIAHLRRRLIAWTGRPAYMLRHLDKVLYIARQETLDDDWKRLQELLELPGEVVLPHDFVAAHKTIYPCDLALSDKGTAALREWYAEDYEVLRIAEHLRQGIALPRVPLRARLRSLLGEGRAASRNLLGERSLQPRSPADQRPRAA